MRTLLFSLFIGTTLASFAQAPSRYVEVVVTDTVLLKLQGIDYEVSMPNPYEEPDMSSIPEMGDDPDFDKLMAKHEKAAREQEQHFLELMKANAIPYRLSSTLHAEDYSFNTGRKMNVNSYLVQLSDSAAMARYEGLTKEMSLAGTVHQVHFADVDGANARLMSKLHAQAQAKAGALAVAAGGKIGILISATEVHGGDGSFLEELMKMDRDRRELGEDLMAGSQLKSSMAFRFELLAR